MVQAVRHSSHARSFVGTALIIIIITIIVSTALGGPWRPQANVAGDPRQPSLNFCNTVSLSLPLPRQFILISVGHVLVDLQGLSIISLNAIRFHPFAQHWPPTSVYGILLRSLYLVHCKDLLVLCCISPATAFSRILDLYSAKDFPFEDTQSSFIVCV